MRRRGSEEEGGVRRRGSEEEGGVRRRVRGSEEEGERGEWRLLACMYSEHNELGHLELANVHCTAYMYMYMCGTHRKR